MSLANSLTIGSLTFERQTATQFIEDSSDLSTPDLLIVQNRNLLNNSGTPAQITVKRDKYKSSGVAGVADHRAQAWITFQVIPDQFTQAELLSLEADLHTMVNAQMTRLLRGET